MLAQKLYYVFIAFIQNAGNLFINIVLRFFTEFSDKICVSATRSEYTFTQRHILELIRHTKVCNHALNNIGCTCNIIRSTCRYVTENYLFCSPASKKTVYFVYHIFTGLNKLFFAFFAVLSKAANTMTARYYCNFIYRLMIRIKSRNKSMSCFMNRNKAHLLFIILSAFLFKTNTYLINSIVEIFHCYFLAAIADSKKSSFIYYVCEVGTGKTCSSVSN